MESANRENSIIKIEKVKVTKKGVEFSDYKLTYESKTAFACYNSEYKFWNLQDSDGGQPTDSINTLKNVKEIFRCYVDAKLWK
jgi:hypothetical protein